VVGVAVAGALSLGASACLGGGGGAPGDVVYNQQVADVNTSSAQGFCQLTTEFSIDSSNSTGALHGSIVCTFFGLTPTQEEELAGGAPCDIFVQATYVPTGNAPYYTGPPGNTCLLNGQEANPKQFACFSSGRSGEWTVVFTNAPKGCFTNSSGTGIDNQLNCQFQFPAVTV
jgi:hypothetical protein